jgi:hypothetical protein
MASKVELLEARVASLEKEMRKLKTQSTGIKAIPWYRRIVGAFAGDPVYAEITRLGQEIRISGRRRGR